jgi:ribosomal protein S27E
MDWFRRMMMGRYGTDQLSIALLILYMVLSLILQFIRLPFLSLLALVPLAICFYRIFSRNINRRYEENARFLKWWYPVKTRIQKSYSRFQDRQTHRYFKCPHCSNTLRVPRGKGKISITCPVCRTEFIKKT